MTVGLQLSGRLDNRVKPYEQEVFKGIYLASPLKSIYANNTAPYFSNTGDRANPMQVIDIDEVGYDKRDRREFNGSLTIDWQIPWLKGLSLKALLSYDYNNVSTKQWFKEYYDYTYDPVNDTYNKLARHSISTMDLKDENSFNPFTTIFS